MSLNIACFYPCTERVPYIEMLKLNSERGGNALGVRHFNAPNQTEHFPSLSHMRHIGRTVYFGDIGIELVSLLNCVCVCVCVLICLCMSVCELINLFIYVGVWE